MTKMVLPQLVEAEAQLAAEEAALYQQLAELQEKIKGIQTVIAMFGSQPSEPRIEEVPVKAEEPVVEVVGEPLVVETPTVTAAAKPAKGTKATQSKAAKKVTPTKKAEPVAKKATAPKKGVPAKTVTTTTKTTKRTGKESNWQGYVRSEFGEMPLPDVVENIVKSKPKSVLKIADVMSEIFPEDMPKNHFLKARNRISNILSAGARSGDWYRGRGGTYSVSEKALKAS
jgi:hypothetical protein